MVSRRARVNRRDPPELLFITHQAPVASLEPVVSVRQDDDSLGDG